jgi:hypothetical protein
MASRSESEAHRSCARRLAYGRELELGRADPIESRLLLAAPSLLLGRSLALPRQPVRFLLLGASLPCRPLGCLGALALLFCHALVVDARALLRHQRLKGEK